MKDMRFMLIESMNGWPGIVNELNKTGYSGYVIVPGTFREEQYTENRGSAEEPHIGLYVTCIIERVEESVCGCK